MLGILLNLVAWLLMFATQNKDAREGRIPPQSPQFLYMQDFRTNGIMGDVIGLSLIDFAVVARLVEFDKFFVFLGLGIVVSILVGYVARRLFYWSCTTPGHKNDWGYLGDQITNGGRVHLKYFQVQASVVVLGIWLTATAWEQILILGWIGAAIYGFAFILDWRAKRFDRVKT